MLSYWQWLGISSVNGLARNRRQSVTWTNADPVTWRTSHGVTRPQWVKSLHHSINKLPSKYFIVTHFRKIYLIRQRVCGIAQVDRLREYGYTFFTNITSLALCVGNLPSQRGSNAPLQWRHHERDGVSNHQPHDCLLNRLFRRRSTKTSKLRVTGLCEGNSPVTGEFPAQRASNAENVSIWWLHHGKASRCHDVSCEKAAYGAW